MSDKTSNSPAKDAVTKPNLPLGLSKLRKLRIGPAEIRGMGELLAQRLTETEACGVLGLAPRSWFRWKARQRNGGRFATLLEEITGQKIAAHFSNIEQAAFGAGPHKKADWRASSYVLSATAPNRFASTGGVSVQVNVMPPPIPPAVISTMTRAIYGQPSTVGVKSGEEIEDRYTPILLANAARNAEQPGKPRLLADKKPDGKEGE